MTTADLLAELEPLTHAARVRRMIELGRSAAGDERARATIAALAAADGVYARLLALMSLYGSRDGAQVGARLDDPSRTIRHAASRLVAIVCDDDQAGAALERIVEKALLRTTIARLVARRRIAPVEAFLRAHLGGELDAVIVDLLPLASRALVERERAAIEARGGTSCWTRLAVHHPALYAAWIESSVATTGTVDVRQRWRAFPALPALADRAPDATLALVRRLFELGEEPFGLAATLQLLLRRRPRETFDLIRARHEAGRPTRPPGAFGAVTFDRVASALGGDRLDYLIRHAPTRLGEGKRGLRWYLSLAPDDRAAVIRAFLDGGRGGTGAFLFRFVPADGPDADARERAFQRWSHAAQAGDGTIAPEVLDWLPRDLREREARRHLDACAALIDKPERRLAYARLLSFAQAKEALAAFLGHPEGLERARAQRLLIATVRHDRGAMAAVLDNVRARKFEQDPVRLAMIDALVGVELARFAAGDLAQVGAIVQDALDAADLSAATASAVERLVARLFRIDGAWGATWLARLFAVRGRVATWGLGEGLTRAEAARLVPALAELARTWATQERAHAIVTLAQSLGIRLAVVTPLLDALETLARELPFAGVAAAALALIATHDRPRLATLVPALLAVDTSFVLIPVVAAHVSARRQDLLAAIFDRAPMTGRFATGRSHWVIDFGRGHGRWTERLQRRYADTLAALLDDPARDVPTARFALTALVRLAYVDGAQAIRFASDPRPPVREIAIRALPWLDDGRGVPVLIECLGDDRARYAIYALRKAFSEMRRERVLAALRAVPTTKVTVAKEVVRLLGDLGGDDAYVELLALDRPGLHRDVRIALLRALWDHLERPTTWPVFERAVADPDWIVASKLADIPLGRLSVEAETRVVALLATILGRTEPEARLDLLKRAVSLPLRDPRRLLFQRLLAHLGTRATAEASAALQAVLARMWPGEVGEVVARLAALASDRRRLVALLPVLSSRIGPYALTHHVAVIDGFLAVLRTDRHAVPQWLALASRRLGFRELVDALVDLATRELLHVDAMQIALAAVRASAHPSQIEQLLRSHRDPQLRRLALEALIEAAAPKDGWTPERRALLDGYRRDRADGVAGPAAFVFPPE